MSALTAAWPKLEFTDERLDNGLRLIMSVDGLAPIVAVNLWYNVGSRNEVEGKTGFAHLFEHVMFEGSAHVAKGEHFKLINNAGGALNGSTWTNRTNYFEWAPSHQLELMLWLEADRMGGLLEAVNQENLDNQRDVVKNERRFSVDNRPYGNWLEKLQNSLFAVGHPYHHEVYGSMEDLSAASLDDVHDFFRTYYAPNNAVLSIVGDFDSDEARAWVKKYFGGIPPNPNIPPVPETAVPFALGGEYRETVPDRVPLSRIIAGYRSPEDGTKENDAITMGGAVLSMGKGSRLYRRLVRERQLAQDIQFSTISQPGVSMTVGWATARPQVALEDLEPAFFEVIESLYAEDITDDEMQRARAQLERLIIDHLMTVAARADWLSEHATVFGDPGKVNERLPALMRVTAGQIRQVASEILIPDNRIVLSYVPGEKKEEAK